MEYINGAKVVTDDFWYDLTSGGYIKPEEILSNQSDIARIKNALKVLSDWQSDMENQGIIEYT